MEDIRNGATEKLARWLCTGVCVSVCVATSSECLHKCWFCSSKPFNSAFFHRLSPLCSALISSPLFIATQLASSPFASIRHTYHFITSYRPIQSCQKTEKKPSTTSSLHRELQTTWGSGHQAISYSWKVRAWQLWDNYEPWAMVKGTSVCSAVWERKQALREGDII